MLFRVCYYEYTHGYIQGKLVVFVEHSIDKEVKKVQFYKSLSTYRTVSDVFTIYRLSREDLAMKVKKER